MMDTDARALEVAREIARYFIEPDSQSRIEQYVPDVAALVCKAIQDATTKLEKENAELREALRGLTARLKLIMSWPDRHFSYDLPIELGKELAEAERLLGGSHG